MKQKEIVLTRGVLARKGACKRGIEEFKRRYPNGHATLTEVLSDLQELANTSTGYVKYVEYAKWLIRHFPPTQKPLVLDELTDKFIFHNGDLTIKKGVKGDHIIIGNGDLNIEDDVNLTGWVDIQAKNVKGQNITLYDCAGISAGKIKAKNIKAYGDAGILAGKIKAKNITAYYCAGILANKTIDAKNINAYGEAVISAVVTIAAQNIAACGEAVISAGKIKAKNIKDDDGTRIRGNIIFIKRPYNLQNTNTAS